MNASQFAKAYKLFDRVKELDAEILEIEKTAQLVAEKKTEIKLSLKVNNLEKKGGNEIILDEDGSLSTRRSAYGQSLFYSMGILE